MFLTGTTLTVLLYVTDLVLPVMISFTGLTPIFTDVSYRTHFTVFIFLTDLDLTELVVFY